LSISGTGAGSGMGGRLAGGEEREILVETFHLQSKPRVVPRARVNEHSPRRPQGRHASSTERKRLGRGRPEAQRTCFPTKAERNRAGAENGVPRKGRMAKKKSYPTSGQGNRARGRRGERKRFSIPIPIPKQKVHHCRNNLAGKFVLAQDIRKKRREKINVLTVVALCYARLYPSQEERLQKKLERAGSGCEDVGSYFSGERERSELEGRIRKRVKKKQELNHDEQRSAITAANPQVQGHQKRAGKEKSTHAMRVRPLLQTGRSTNYGQRRLRQDVTRLKSDRQSDGKGRGGCVVP